MGTQRQYKGGSQARPSPTYLTSVRVGLLQRKCACGSTAGLSGECAACSTKKRFGLQTKLKVNEPGNIYEREADRVADQVMATPVNSRVSGTPRIQRFSGQSNGQTEAAPASVDQALASPGRPMEPALRQDMEQHFGYDFSRVRVHSGAATEQSAQEVNANAYTVGHNIVFGAGQFAPGTHEGRRLIAHELTHVVQQRGAGLHRPDSVHAHSPHRALQREEKEKESTPESEKEESLKVASEVETRWKAIRDGGAADFDEVKPWLENGDAVVRLIREHTELAIKARERGDPEASMAYQHARESDLVMYRLISWHVVVHVNLLGLEPDIDRLTSAFNADDRAFAGRDKVEELTRTMDDLIDPFTVRVPWRPFAGRQSRGMASSKRPPHAICRSSRIGKKNEINQLDRFFGAA